MKAKWTVANLVEEMMRLTSTSEQTRRLKILKDVMGSIEPESVGRNFPDVSWDIRAVKQQAANYFGLRLDDVQAKELLDEIDPKGAVAAINVELITAIGKKWGVEEAPHIFFSQKNGEDE